MYRYLCYRWLKHIIALFIHGKNLYPWQEPLSMAGTFIHGKNLYPWQEPSSMARTFIHGKKLELSTSIWTYLSHCAVLIAHCSLLSAQYSLLTAQCLSYPAFFLSIFFFIKLCTHAMYNVHCTLYCNIFVILIMDRSKEKKKNKFICNQISLFTLSSFKISRHSRLQVLCIAYDIVVFKKIVHHIINSATPLLLKNHYELIKI